MHQAGRRASWQHPVPVTGSRQHRARRQRQDHSLAASGGQEGGQPRDGLHHRPHNPRAVRATRSLHCPAVFPPPRKLAWPGREAAANTESLSRGAHVCVHGALLAPGPVIKELL